jgi:hypothetical protein
MSTRLLAVTAAVLFVLSVVAGVLLADRLGYLREEEPPPFDFVNRTLGVARGQRVILRPIVANAPALRLTFLATIAEPAPEDPVAPVPHLRAGAEESEEGEWLLRPGEAGVQPVLLCQMGALTAQEWLDEIRPVVEVREDGTERLLLRAQFGHRTGPPVAYYFDPQAPVPAFGWTRSELLTPDGPPEIHFASDGGRIRLTDPK